MAFHHTIRPRYAEVDMQKVVFNGHWLTYCDDASTRFYESLGFDPRDTFVEHGAFDAMVVKAVIEWSGSATFDDVVQIEVCPEHVGNKSYSLRFTARIEGRLICECIITYVCVVPGTKKSCPIPEALRSKLDEARLGSDGDGPACS